MADLDLLLLGGGWVGVAAGVVAGCLRRAAAWRRDRKVRFFLAVLGCVAWLPLACVVEGRWGRLQRRRPLRGSDATGRLIRQAYGAWRGGARGGDGGGGACG